MSRWSEKTKKEATKLLKDGVCVDDIASQFEMSKSSVILLKYSVSDNKDRIKCEVCGSELKQITVKHLLSHDISIEQYKEKFPHSPMFTQKRAMAYKNFKSANKGKTYDEIYGEKESKIKRDKISKNQIGRVCPHLAGTGITGTRRDTGTFARSTYEANVDRVFIYENKRYTDELELESCRFDLVRENGEKITYCPDRIDNDGLFERGAYLEIKGYMYPEDWEKIQLFRKQYPDKKLLIISSDKKYLDINYDDLESKYKPKIFLWEGERQNYKTRPDLYKIGYKTPEHILYLNDNYPHHIISSIADSHLLFIANKCLSYNKVSLGVSTYIDKVELIAITNRRFGASKRSSGIYNFELWRVITNDNKIFYVTNQEKTNIFYCYQEQRYGDLIKFFNSNCDLTLKYGKKIIVRKRPFIPDEIIVPDNMVVQNVFP
jgi:hypothetical protein